MNIDEYEYLVTNSFFSLDENNCVVCQPLSYKAGKKIKQIIKKNHIQHISFEAFQELSDHFRPMYMARKKSKDTKAFRFSLMSPQEVSSLPVEQKLEYMEILFPANQSVKEAIDVCTRNEENIKACMFHIDFPKHFWADEKKLADRYVALVASQPEITETLKNWANTSLEDKKHMLQKAVKIFEYVYHIAPQDIEFFTPEEERARNKELGLPENTHINAAYQSEGKICFNTERLQNSHSFFAISVLFHEGTHLRQHFQTFDDPIVERIINCNLNNTTVYENFLNNKKSAAYKDFYAMQPCEVHAHALQEYVEQQLEETTGIQKTHNTALDSETQKIHLKTFAIAKIAQYKSAKR